jgi:predicted RNA binding protein YcfA (HicA-like mRNA interferase family)
VINYGKLRSLTARELISASERDGFSFDRARGSHHHYYHPDGRRVTVTYKRPGQTFPLGTLKQMIERDARWTEDDLKRLGLIKVK